MTAQFLSTELGNIIQESKKKNTELRNAAEKSLQELKSLPATSESQIAGDLQRRPHFINSFLVACKTKNGKLALPAVSCLQRLIVSNGLAKDRLQEVLEAFRECSNLGLDVQLKILQSLSSVLQNYSDVLEGELQASILQVCITLQQIKAPAVSRTASATFQQLVSSLFERVEQEDEKKKDVAIVTEITLNEDKVPLRSAAYDAYRVFGDVCLLTEGERPKFLHHATLSQTFGLELIESILTNHSDLMESHREQAHILRERVIPLLTRFLSERLSFPITVRSVRILCILLREHLETVKAECEIPLGLLNHTLETDTTNSWRRALCMETFRIIYSTPDLAIDMFSVFDEQETKRNIIQENLSSLVRLSTEKPSLIGVGTQSSFPAGLSASKAASQEQAVLEASSVAGMIGSDVGVNEINATGISNLWSSMKTPCLDQLDKTEPPSIPETYAYSLVLTCIGNLTEGLAKVVLPLAVPTQVKDSGRVSRQHEDDHEETQGSNGHQDVEEPKEILPAPAAKQRKRGRSIPLNPLMMESNAARVPIKTVATLVNECWPAVMATLSTFLYAALDSDFYRGLIRSCQKFTQVAGILRLSTPRDAFLTTLAKAAVPPNIFKNDMLSPTSPMATPRPGSGTPNLSEGFFGPSDGGHSRRNSIDMPGSFLSQRNLMCLRALINLAIALGPILENSWSIILSNLQTADTMLNVSGTAATARDYKVGSQTAQANDASTAQTSLSTEIAAVEAAVTRLFQSTANYPNDSFIQLLKALCDLAAGGKTPILSGSLRGRPGGQSRNTSVSGIPTIPAPQAQQSHFAIAKLGELAQINLQRLALDASAGGWEVLLDCLLNIAAEPTNENAARLMAADIVGSVAVETIASTAEEEEAIRGEAQHRSLSALEKEIKALYKRSRNNPEPVSSPDLDIHRSVLEALRAILEQNGESLVTGWDVIYAVIDSVFHLPNTKPITADFFPQESKSANEVVLSQHIPAKLIRSAFGSIQLICSDYLGAGESATLIVLIDILSRFCLQDSELNISLTTISLFWNVSDYLQSRVDIFSLEDHTVDWKDRAQFSSYLRQLASDGSATALWLVLQRRLASLTEDDRADVRSGATHTTFRILDNCGDQLSPSLLDLYFQDVLIRMLRLNLRVQTKARASGAEINTRDAAVLNGGSKIMIQGLSQSVCTYFEMLSQLASFADMWHSIMEVFASYITIGSSELSTVTFNSVSQILSVIDDRNKLGSSAFNEVASLWAGSLPQTTDTEQSKSSNEGPLVAYIETLKQMYRLTESQITAGQIEMITENLKTCITVATPEPYSNDIDKMTNLQTIALKAFAMLRTDIEGVPQSLVKTLANFVQMPYQESTEGLNKQGLSYIAFAKSSMDLLQTVVVSHAEKQEIYEDDILTSALSALSRSISLKYVWTKQGSKPALWQQATSTALRIIEEILTSGKNPGLTPVIESGLWSEIIKIAAGIIDADLDSPPSNDELLEDETHDLELITKLQHIIVPLIDQPSLSVEIRFEYAYSFFRNSLIHQTTLEELPSLPDEWPLKNLYKVRFGRTFDLPFNPRIRMCYFCLDALFAFVSTPVEAERSGGGKSLDAKSSLARSTFPFLILRCALPLKTYIADQPLRGRMPTPTSQRLEILYVLRKMRELDCDPAAIPEEHLIETKENIYPRNEDPSNSKKFSVSIQNPHKRHLELLAPLVNKALGAARMDAEVASEMRKVLNVVFGGA